MVTVCLKLTSTKIRREKTRNNASTARTRVAIWGHPTRALGVLLKVLFSYLTTFSLQHKPWFAYAPKEAELIFVWSTTCSRRSPTAALGDDALREVLRFEWSTTCYTIPTRPADSKVIKATEALSKCRSAIGK